MTVRRILATVFVAAFAAHLGSAGYGGLLPPIVIKAYACLSVVSFFAYHADKEFTERGLKRISETYILALDLTGGWPGGLLAQTLLGNKENKAVFQGWFWLAVLLNIGVYALYFRPSV